MSLFTDVTNWTNEQGIVYNKVDVWAVKNLLAIEWFIKPFTQIAKKYFKKWVYIDFFCGAGLMKFRNKHLCKGSALVALFLAKEHSFSEYYFFDKDKGKCEELEKRIDRLKHELSLPKDIIIHKPEPLSFEDASIKLFGRDGTINKKSMSLILIDPEDIKFTTWDRIESILMYGKVDLILIVMRFGLALNHSIAKKDVNSPIAETMNKFFGDENWKNLKNGEELINYYRYKIQGLGYNTYIMDIKRTGQSIMYNVIFASQNDSVGKIFGDLAIKMEKITPELLSGVINNIQRESFDLDTWTDSY